MHTIIITSTLKDLPVLKIAIIGLKKYLKFDRLIIIVPKIYYENFLNLQEMGKIEILVEESIIPPERVRSLLEAQGNSRWQWYYQQYLKLMAASLFSSEITTIWDSDTIPLNAIKIFDDDGKIIHDMSMEYHKPYFEKIRSCMDIREDEMINSFISQKITFKHKHLVELLKIIEERTREDWITIFSKRISDHELYFSEYELIGNYLHKFYPNDYVLSNRNWTRKLLQRKMALSKINLGYLKNTNPNFIYGSIESNDLLENLTLSASIFYRLRFLGIKYHLKKIAILKMFFWNNGL